MANLIPPDAKKALIIEYWTRVITVWFILIGFGFVVSIALKFPTFVLLQDQLKVYSGQYHNAKETEADFESADNKIEEANKLSAILAGSVDSDSATALTEVLETIAGEEILIKSFKYKFADGQVNTITVSGIAETRLALANFRDNLEDDPLFSEANLPISNLAKDVDIAFNIDITLAP
jgi:Tfp pilus assembly protein PilN